MQRLASFHVERYNQMDPSHFSIVTVSIIRWRLTVVVVVGLIQDWIFVNSLINALRI